MALNSSTTHTSTIFLNSTLSFNSTTNNTQTCTLGSDGSDSTVSWQSAWWGLFPLVLNNIVQDVGTSNDQGVTTFARTAVRLSPFMCLIDALWDVYCFTVIYTRNRANTVKTVIMPSLRLGWKLFTRDSINALKIRWSSFTRDVTESAHETLGRVGLKMESKDLIHFYARLIPIFLAFSQLVKLTAFKGVPFTTFCAWCYFIGFLVVELLRAVAALHSPPQAGAAAARKEQSLLAKTKGWLCGFTQVLTVGQVNLSHDHSDRDATELPLWETAATRLRNFGAALIGKRSAEAPGPAASTKDQERPQMTPEAARRISVLVLLIALCILLQLGLMISLAYPLAKIIQDRYNPWIRLGLPTFFTLKNAAGISLATSVRRRQHGFALGWAITFSLIPSHAAWLNVVTLVVCLSIVYWRVCGFFGRVFIAVPELKSVRAKIGLSTVLQWQARCAVVACAAVVFAHYIAIYDEQGTFKPDWTEQLG